VPIGNDARCPTWSVTRIHVYWKVKECRASKAVMSLHQTPCVRGITQSSNSETKFSSDGFHGFFPKRRGRSIWNGVGTDRPFVIGSIDNLPKDCSPKATFTKNPGTRCVDQRSGILSDVSKLLLGGVRCQSRIGRENDPRSVILPQYELIWLIKRGTMRDKLMSRHSDLTLEGKVCH